MDNDSREISPPRRWTKADTLCVVAIVVLGVLFSLPTMTRPLSASHDAKSALIVRQMVEQHRWFVTDLDTGWVNKPPVYYWMAAGFSMLAGGVSEWTVRLPSLLACVAAALLTWAFARELWDRWTGLASAAVLATTVHFHLLSQATRLDSMVTLSVLAALFCYWKALVAPGGAWDRKGWTWSCAGHLAIAFGVAVKGPVAIALAGPVVVALLVVRALSREGRLGRDLLRLHPATGAAMVLAIAGPIFLAMDRASNGRFLHYFFLTENLARAGIQVEDVQGFARSYSFFHYFGTIWFSAAPWSLLLPAAFVVAWRGRASSASRALLPVLYFALPFLFLSAVTYKKWAYLMSALPPVAMMVGKLWTDALRGRLDGDATVKWLLRAGSVFLLAAAALAAAFVAGLATPERLAALSGPHGLLHARTPLTIPDEFAAVPGGFLTGTLPMTLLVAGAVVAALALWRRRTGPAFALLLVLAAAGTLYSDFVFRPAASERVSQRLFAERVRELLAERPPDGPPLYVCAGEPYELVFYLRSPIRGIHGEDTAAFLKRVRASGSPEPGEAAWVILWRGGFEDLCRTVGPLKELAATGPGQSRESSLVLTAVKLAPAD